MRIGAALCVALLLVGGSASRAADDGKASCPDAFDDTFSSCILKFADAEPAEGLQRSGSELIRAFILKRIRLDSPILVIEAVSLPTGKARLTIRDPKQRDVSRTYDLDSARFDALKAKVQSLRFDGAVLHGGKSSPEPQPDNTVCLDPASAYVDVAMGEKIATTQMDYCSDEDADFLDYFLALAVSLDTNCTEAKSNWPADALRACISAKQ